MSIRAPNNRNYDADASDLDRAADAMDTNPPVNDAGSWLDFATQMLREAAEAMAALEAERDDLRKERDDLQAQLDERGIA